MTKLKKGFFTIHIYKSQSKVDEVTFSNKKSSYPCFL
jgi:hypothetical protein